MLSLLVLARRAVGLLQPHKDVPIEDLEIADDVKVALQKVKLRTRNDYVTAATFILQTLLSQEVPRSLNLQLKKHLRRLETAVANSDEPEAKEANSEVLCLNHK